MKRLSFLGAIALAVGVTLAVAPTVGANAHDYLVSSTPTNEAVVTDALTTVSVTFNDVIIDLSGIGAQNLVYVTGPGDAKLHYETGCASVLGRDISAPVALGEPGIYTVSWRIVSSDGHPVTSEITFDYEPSSTSGAIVSAGTATSACAQAADSTGAGDAGDSANSGGVISSENPQSATTTSSNTASPLAEIWWLVIGFAGIVVVALTAWLVVAFVSRKRGG